MQPGLLAVYCIAVLAFCVAFRLLRVVATATEILRIASTALAVIRDPDLDDAGKERQTQALSLAMLKGFFVITLKGLVLVGITVVPALLATRLGIVGLEPLIAFSVRWDVVLVTVVALSAAAFVLRKRRETERH